MSRMPSVPTIQLEGPQMMERPSVIEPYQETPVIFPKPNIAVGPGFDWGAIAESGARLGLEFVEGWNKQTFNRKAMALQSLEDKTKQIVDLNLEVNDIDATNIALQEHEDAVVDLLGFNPYSEEPSNEMAFKFAAKAREFRSNMDMATTKAQRGWTDTIAVDNYIKFSQGQQRSIADAPDKLEATNKAIETQRKMYEDISGGLQPGTPLKEKGFTVEQRKLLTQIEKDYTDLVEQRDKLEGKGQEPQLKTTSENVRGQVNLGLLLIEQANSLFEQADEIRKSGVPGAEATASGFEARANALASTGYRNYSIARSWMVEAYKNDIMNQVGGPVEFTEVENPLSLEALQALVETGLVHGPTFEAVTDFEKKSQALLTNSAARAYKTQTDLYARQGVSAKARIDASVGQASTTLKALDEAISRANEAGNSDAANALVEQKATVLINLRQEILQNNIIPFLQNEEVSQRALTKAFIPAPLPFVGAVNRANYTANFLRGLDFSPDSLAVVQEIEGLNSGIISETYSHAIDKINALEKENIDVPKGSEAVRKAQEKRVSDALRAVEYFMGEELEEGEPTSEDKRKMGLNLAQRRLSANADVSIPSDQTRILPPVNEAIELAEKNKGNDSFLGNKIPFTVETLMLTPWYGEVLENAGKMGNLEDARAYMQRAFNALTTDVGNDIKVENLERIRVNTPLNTPAQNMVEKYIKDDSKNLELTATAFLFLPDNIRENIIARLGEVSQNNPTLDNRIEYLNYIHNSYNKTQSPIEFLREEKLPTPFQLRLAKDYAIELEKHNKSIASNGRTQGSDYKDIAEFKGAYDKAFDQIIRGIQVPGYSYVERMSNSRRAYLEQTFGPMLLVEFAKNVDETGNIDLTKAQEATSRLLEKLNTSWSRGRRFDSFEETFTKTTGEPLETPTGVITTISKGVMSGAGRDVPEADRAHVVGLSGNYTYVPNSTKEQQTLYLGQVGSVDRITTTDYDNFVKKDPFSGLIRFGVLANQSISQTRLSQLGKNQADSLDRLVVGGIGDLPKDNFTVMSVMGAIALLDPMETNIDKAVATVQAKAAAIRKALVSKDTSSFSMEVREETSNQVPSQRAATIYVKSGDAVIAKFQPNTYSVSPVKATKELVEPVLTMTDEKIRTEYVFNPKLSQQTKDEYATQLLLNSDKTEIFSNEYTIGRGVAARDAYVKETNPDGTVRILKGQQWKMYGDRFKWQWTMKEPEVSLLPSGVQYAGRGNERQKKAMAILLPGYFFGAAKEFKFGNIPAQGPKTIYTSPPVYQGPDLLNWPGPVEPSPIGSPEMVSDTADWTMVSDFPPQDWFNNVVSNLERLGIEKSKAEKTIQTITDSVTAIVPEITTKVESTMAIDEAVEPELMDKVRAYTSEFVLDLFNTIMTTRETVENIGPPGLVVGPTLSLKGEDNYELLTKSDANLAKLAELYPRSKAYRGKPKKDQEIVLVDATGVRMVWKDTQEEINPYEYYNLFDYFERTPDPAVTRFKEQHMKRPNRVANMGQERVNRQLLQEIKKAEEEGDLEKKKRLEELKKKFSK